MKKLIFDTETAGLPSSWNANIDDISVWPNIVELAWIVLNERSQATESKTFIIKPQNFVIPKEASDIHGITNEKAIQEGTDLKFVLKEFERDLEDVDLLIAHNVDFDFPVLNCEFIRSSLKTKFSDIETLCTMKSTTSLCNIPGKYGPKWPKLEELYNYLFSKNFQGAHRAINDVMACAECYIELKKIGHYSHY